MIIWQGTITINTAGTEHDEHMASANLDASMFDVLKRYPNATSVVMSLAPSVVRHPTYACEARSALSASTPIHS
jgi:hypothetical protein